VSADRAGRRSQRERPGRSASSGAVRATSPAPASEEDFVDTSPSEHKSAIFSGRDSVPPARPQSAARPQA
jgi:hypothetical protein